MYFLATYLSHVRNLVVLFLNLIFGGFFCLEKKIPIFFPTIFPWAWHLMPSCPCHGLGSPPVFDLQIVPKFGFPIFSISNFYSIDSNQENSLVDSCEVECTQEKTPKENQTNKQTIWDI